MAKEVRRREDKKEKVAGIAVRKATRRKIALNPSRGNAIIAAEKGTRRQSAAKAGVREEKVARGEEEKEDSKGTVTIADAGGTRQQIARGRAKD